tara:strand:+ start:5582 stop:5884 length:303 start_codon:yes stop_codon:yes gene_type:complete
MNNDTSNNTSNTNRNSDEVGALWKRKSRGGMTYLAGHVKHDELGKEVTSKVVVFSNDKKSNDKQPDYRIYLSKPMGEERATTSAQPAETVTSSSSEEDLL